MAEFLTTKGIAAQIETIIKEADKSLVLISPYLKISDSFFIRLKAASERGVRITLIYRDADLSDAQYDLIASLKSVDLRSLPNLHAKCYFNESTMVMSSMNFYEHSENNNVEMGILIDRDKDTDVFKKAKHECDYTLTLSNADVRSSKNKNHFGDNIKTAPKKNKDNFLSEGCCIRCNKEIPFNPEKPFCNKCYSSWSQWEDDEYPEKFCHNCGKEKASSKAIPQCRPCFKESERKY